MIREYLQQRTRLMLGEAAEAETDTTEAAQMPEPVDRKFTGVSQLAGARARLDKLRTDMAAAKANHATIAQELASLAPLDAAMPATKRVAELTRRAGLAAARDSYANQHQTLAGELRAAESELAGAIDAANRAQRELDYHQAKLEELTTAEAALLPAREAARAIATHPRRDILIKLIPGAVDAASAIEEAMLNLGQRLPAARAAVAEATYQRDRAGRIDE
jgi:chromosome segregation ATPase